MSSKLQIKNKIESDKSIKVAPFKKDIRKTTPHKHNNYFEIIYLSEGSGYHFIDSRKYEVKPPIMYFIRKEQMHCWELDSEPEGFVVIIKKSFIEKSLDNELKSLFTKIRKAGSLNLSNRTETWEYIYLNYGNQLKSGMYANALLKLGRKENSFVIPSTAVATNLEKRFVIRLKDGQAEWVDVRNGITMNDKVEIFGNLNEGNVLLVRATDEIKQGTKPVPRR